MLKINLAQAITEFRQLCGTGCFSVERNNPFGKQLGSMFVVFGVLKNLGQIFLDPHWQPSKPIHWFIEPWVTLSELIPTMHWECWGQTNCSWCKLFTCFSGCISSAKFSCIEKNPVFPCIEITQQSWQLDPNRLLPTVATFLLCPHHTFWSPHVNDSCRHVETLCPVAIHPTGWVLVSFRLKGTSRSLLSNLLLKVMIMASGQVAQGFIQLSLEDICRHRLPNLLDQLLTAWLPHGDKISLYTPS